MLHLQLIVVIWLVLSSAMKLAPWLDVFPKCIFYCSFFSANPEGRFQFFSFTISGKKMYICFLVLHNTSVGFAFSLVICAGAFQMWYFEEKKNWPQHTICTIIRFADRKSQHRLNVLCQYKHPTILRLNFYFMFPDVQIKKVQLFI